ncbi:uncharacterized protein RAG0_11036 [Rhynchosporium agropyri]|uniref:Uncharacterized protein n=1 Tax=Rhynchosporium agropyri TaxID=914238 RepID=A0A1E1L2C2_9HELO|nr:uncharacterized protein RAG0_11036 [Rhynchosporium agropyri]
MFTSVIFLSAGLVLAIYGFTSLYLRFHGNKIPHSQNGKLSTPRTGDSKLDPFKIDPLPNFDWRRKAPLKIRPYKSTYHLTMGVSACTFSEFIEMDRNYLDRITLRKEIMREHHDIAIQAKPEVKPAIDELYTWLLNEYLPTRYPTMFSVTSLGLLNHTTSTHIPFQPSPDPAKTFEILGENLDEDFLILLASDDGDSYMLKGFVNCFPAGFNTKDKLGLKLRDIHTPVPGYKQKLELSMDRFFDRLEVGKVVKRANASQRIWSINTEEKLFAASGLHLYGGEKKVDEKVDVNTASVYNDTMELVLTGADFPPS